MRAEPSAQLRLLDVQALDAKLDQLAHRRRTLPELVELQRLAGRRDELAGLRIEAETATQDLSRQQRKADGDVEQVKARRARNQERLDRGQVASPKELEGLQHEIVSLNRRISDLEDAELEVMEELESAQRRLTEAEESMQQVETRTAELAAARDEAFAGIDAEVGKARTERAELAADMPADLLGLYDKLRAQMGGVGAAALQGRRCGGCRLELTPAYRGEIAQAPAHEVLRCEECRRILVRVPESGV